MSQITKLSGSVTTTTFITSGTWTKRLGTKVVTILGYNGGNGGGSGAQGSSASSGGAAGGAAGDVFYYSTLASNIGATATITIGAGGSGAASQTNIDSNGISGTRGGISSFGNITTFAQNPAQGGTRVGTVTGTGNICTAGRPW